MFILNIINKKDIPGFFPQAINVMHKNITIHNNPTAIAYQDTDNIKITDQDLSKFINKGIITIAFKDYNQLLSISRKFKQEYKQIMINTLYEEYIILINSLKKDLGQQTTENTNIFLNKYLQRSIISQKYPETTTPYILIDNARDINVDKTKLNFPVFVKPTNGLTSIGTSKINNKIELKKHLTQIQRSLNTLKNKGFTKQQIIIEEYIPGDLYAMSYFVDEDQNIFLNKFMKQRDNIGGEHTHLIGGEVSEEIQKEVNMEQFKEFVYKTVKGANIKNSFICHQFKQTPDKQLKTIEINGRVGGFNEELYEEAYDINFYNTHTYNNNNIGSSAFIRFYPREQQIFKGYNDQLYNRIKQLDSIKKFFLFKKNKNTIIGLPAQGYEYYGLATLSNQDIAQFKKDLNFILKNYYNILL